MNRMLLRQVSGRVLVLGFLAGALQAIALGQSIGQSTLVTVRETASAAGNGNWQPYQQRQIRDSKGFTWSFDSNGNVSSNARAFSHAGQIYVNNSSSGMQQRFMSPDGSRFRFSGRVQQYPWTRLIKVDRKAGTVRYLETFTNPQPQPQTLAIRLSIQTRSSNTAAITSGGQVFRGRAYNGPIPPEQVGFVVQTRSTSYPTPIVYLCGAEGDVRPSVANSSSSNQSFNINYSVTIPAGESATLLWGLAQHQHLNTTPNAEAVAALFKPFLDKEFTKDIPKELRSQIVNNDIRPATEGSFGPLLEPLTQLADAHDVERGEKHVLIVGDESRVPGRLADGPVKVSTRLGEATVPMAQVAGLAGGGGVGRQPRVFLRSGEVLTGSVDLAQVQFDAENGLRFELDSEHLVALLTKAAETDGRPGPTRTHWLQTQFGDRLELRPDKNSFLHGTSMWGPVEVPLSHVKGLARSQEGLPVHQIELLDGSKFWLILQGESLSVPSKTLGTMSVPVAVIDRLGTVEPPPEEEEEETEEPAQEKPEKKPAASEGTYLKSLQEAIAERLPEGESADAETGADAEAEAAAAVTSAPASASEESASASGETANASKSDKSAENGRTAAEDESGSDGTGSVGKPGEDDASVAAPEPVTEPVTKASALWMLTGENTASAVFRSNSVTFLTPAGETSIQTADIEQIDRLKDKQGHVSFSIELRDGSRVSGRFESTILPLTFYGQPWSVPVRHVQGFGEPETEE